MILRFPVGLTKENLGMSKRRLTVTARLVLAVTLGNSYLDSSFRLYTRLLRIPKVRQNKDIELDDYWVEMRKSNSSRNETCQLHLDLTHSSPLSGAPWYHTRPAPPRPIIPTSPAILLLLIQHQLQHIIRELWELETHSLELGLCIVSEAVTPGRPESSDRLADCPVVWVRLFVHEARVSQLAFGSGWCAVDLGVCEGFEVREAEALCESVDTGVHEKTGALVVGDGLARVFFEGRVARGGCSFGEVLACVEVFNYRAHGINITVGKGDLARLEGVSTCALLNV